MTDRKQFEAMLEALINEDQETAKDIFHDIVVNKSREIYEELLESDFGIYEVLDNETDDSFDDDDETDDDETDDLFGDDETGDIDNRVQDLEDALDDLRAEFDKILAGEESEENNLPDIHGDEFGDDENDIGDDEFGNNDESDDSFGDDEQFAKIMEYVNKVSLPKHGDNGVQNKSVFNKSKYNDMGGSASNIARGDVETKGGTAGGLLKPTTEVNNAGNQNKPGANVGKTAFKKQVKGGGLDKQTGFNKPGQNVGAETGKNSRDGEKNTKSIIKPR